MSVGKVFNNELGEGGQWLLVSAHPGVLYISLLIHPELNLICIVLGNM